MLVGFRTSYILVLDVWQQRWMIGPSWSEQYVYETLFVVLAEFEERCKEPERARFIYNLLLIIFLQGELRICIKSLWRLRNSMVIRKGLRMPLLGIGGFSMKMKINYAFYEEIKTEDVERTRDIFKNYIEIELQLGNIDRCRKLYELYLEWFPENCYAWSKYAELERSLAETELARTIFELAISQPALDMP
ncbi:unnamed protein product [Brassica oleracea var. botrytis]|uniref:(rape) hypothetical protein n=1 Tax=Brassica napus TaxID=3708 RepID=A0A816LL20_BRANA|nr:unnamed protein product [Brassica napus]